MGSRTCTALLALVGLCGCDGIRAPPLTRRSVLTRSTQALAFVMALPSKTSGQACAAEDLPAIMKAVTRRSAGMFDFDENFATPALTSPKELLVEIKASRRRPAAALPPEPAAAARAAYLSLRPSLTLARPQRSTRSTIRWARCCWGPGWAWTSPASSSRPQP